MLLSKLVSTKFLKVIHYNMQIVRKRACLIINYILEYKVQKKSKNTKFLKNVCKKSIKINSFCTKYAKTIIYKFYNQYLEKHSLF